MKVNHIPERMCVACRERGEKESFVRLVSKDGAAHLDLDGNLPGRGAYIHRDSKCLKIAVKKNSLSRALRCSIPEEIYESLECQING